jgi:hypothetical protein
LDSGKVNIQGTQISYNTATEDFTGGGAFYVLNAVRKKKPYKNHTKTIQNPHKNINKNKNMENKKNKKRKQ